MPSSPDQSALNAALRLLSYRPRSIQEVYSRLARRFAIADVDGAIAFLQEQGFVDDMAFAQFWKESRRRNRPSSVAMMRSELSRLGIARDIIDDTLDDVDDEEEARYAMEMAANKMKCMNYESFFKKAGGHLRRRGFSYAIVKGTVERAWSELTDSVSGYEDGND